MEDGIPTNLNISGNSTRKTAARNTPRRFRIPPMITILKMNIDSSNVKLVGSM